MGSDIVPAESAEQNGIIKYTPKILSHAKITGKNNNNFTHTYMSDVNGKNTNFENIEFSYSVITRGYFHKAKFRGCKFVGVRFVDCNFRNAEFVNCEFKYADFSNTRIETDEILRNLPDEPNIRRELLQVMRKNAISIGDVQSARAFVLSEIDAKKEHLRRAWRLEGNYYRQKYSGFGKRIKTGLRRLALTLDSFLWGHGERLWKMAFSIAALVFASTFISAAYWIPSQGDPTLESLGGFLVDAFTYYTSLFLDVGIGEFEYRILWLDWVVAVARYIAFGVMVTGLFRWLSHR